METLNSLIQTLSLDYSFFYHFILALILYFISKSLLFQPYISTMDQRRNFTKGRLAKSEDLDLQIQKNQELYEIKAKKIHAEFQKFFTEIKVKAMESFSKDSLNLEKEQKLWLEKESARLKDSAQKQNQVLEKEIPQLKSALLNKIKS